MGFKKQIRMAGGLRSVFYGRSQVSKAVNDINN